MIFVGDKNSSSKEIECNASNSYAPIKFGRSNSTASNVIKILIGDKNNKASEVYYHPLYDWRAGFSHQITNLPEEYRFYGHANNVVEIPNYSTRNVFSGIWTLKPDGDPTVNGVVCGLSSNSYNIKINKDALNNVNSENRIRIPINVNIVNINNGYGKGYYTYTGYSYDSTKSDFNHIIFYNNDKELLNYKEGSNNENFVYLNEETYITHVEIIGNSSLVDSDTNITINLNKISKDWIDDNGQVTIPEGAYELRAMYELIEYSVLHGWHTEEDDGSIMCSTLPFDVKESAVEIIAKYCNNNNRDPKTANEFVDTLIFNQLYIAPKYWYLLELCRSPNFNYINRYSMYIKNITFNHHSDIGYSNLLSNKSKVHHYDSGNNYYVSEYNTTYNLLEHVTLDKYIKHLRNSFTGTPNLKSVFIENNKMDLSGENFTSHYDGCIILWDRISDNNDKLNDKFSHLISTISPVLLVYQCIVNTDFYYDGFVEINSSGEDIKMSASDYISRSYNKNEINSIIG